MAAKFKVFATPAEVKVEGKQKVYKLAMGDKVLFTAAVNPVRAAANAYSHFGEFIEEVKVLTKDDIADAIAALPDDQRAALLNSVAAAPAAAPAKKVK